MNDIVMLHGHSFSIIQIEYIAFTPLVNHRNPNDSVNIVVCTNDCKSLINDRKKKIPDKNNQEMIININPKKLK